MSDRTRIAVTGLAWQGGNTRSITSMVTELISQTRSELHLTIYRLTSNASLLLDPLAERLAKGVEVTMIISDIESGGVSLENRLLLRELSAAWPNLSVWDFPSDPTGAGLHAKLLVSDRKRALVGSANLSFNGLVLSHELAAVIEGAEAAHVALCIERLRASRHVNRWS